MQFITTLNIFALTLIFTTPYFIYGEYYFYALLLFVGGVSLMRKNVAKPLGQEFKRFRD